MSKTSKNRYQFSPDQIASATCNKVFLKSGEWLTFTVEMTGKMEGMGSVNTSVLLNEQCRKNAEIEGSVCSHCYAKEQLNHYENQAAAYARNSSILNSRVLDWDELPVLNFVYFRFEAFGDLMSETQFINYYNIARKNPETNFALWTKNPLIVLKALRSLGVTSKRGKLPNLQIVLSSLFVDKVQAVPSAFWFVDKVFTVVSGVEKYAELGIERVNCGARSCMRCRRCYKKSENGVEYVYEMLKSKAEYYERRGIEY